MTSDDSALLEAIEEGIRDEERGNLVPHEEVMATWRKRLEDCPEQGTTLLTNDPLTPIHLRGRGWVFGEHPPVVIRGALYLADIPEGHRP